MDTAIELLVAAHRQYFVGLRIKCGLWRTTERDSCFKSFQSPFPSAPSFSPSSATADVVTREAA